MIGYALLMQFWPPIKCLHWISEIEVCCNHLSKIQRLIWFLASIKPFTVTVNVRATSGFGKKHGCHSCNGNSVLSRDLNLKEVSELNGINRIIVRSVCKQVDRANGLSIFQFDAVWFISQFDAVRLIDFSTIDFDRWVQWIRHICYVFNFRKSKIKIYVGVNSIIVSILSFETRCSISASSPV